MASIASRSNISIDLLFKIFKLLNWPSKLALAQTEGGMEEAVVRAILEEWLRTRCSIAGNFPRRRPRRILWN